MPCVPGVRRPEKLVSPCHWVAGFSRRVGLLFVCLFLFSVFLRKNFFSPGTQSVDYTGLSNSRIKGVGRHHPAGSRTFNRAAQAGQGCRSSQRPGMESLPCFVKW